MKYQNLLRVGLLSVLMTLSHPGIAHADPAPAVSDPYTADPLPPSNAMDWKEPAAPPAPRERLTGEDYRNRRDVALSLAPALTLEQAAVLAHGALRVTRVEAGSQGEALGVHIVDTLLKIDDQALDSEQAGRNARTDQEQTLWFLTAAGESRRVKIKPGPIGIRSEPTRDAYATYLVSRARKPQYDADLRLAMVAARGAAADPALAETALFHAWQAGYRGFPLWTRLAALRQREGRFDDTIAAAREAGKDHDAAAFPEEKLAAARLVYAAALASFRLELAREVLRTTPDVAFDDVAAERLDATIEACHPLRDEVLANPVEQLRVHPPRDATEQIARAEIPGFDDQGYAAFAAREFVAHRPVRFQAPSGQFNMWSFGPSGRDVDLAFRFKFDRTDNEVGQWGKDAVIQIVDEASPQRPAVLRLIFFDNAFEAGGSAVPEVRLSPEPPIGLGSYAHVHIAIVGHRAEVIVDGRRLLYQPVLADPATRKLLVTMQFVGIKGNVEEVRWRITDPAAPPAAAKP